uniref:M23 family peptidase n=1 Tax=Heterorhabditis bacteriophora TaxID=37862 RepID=A0A1I7W724_HETBA
MNSELKDQDYNTAKKNSESFFANELTALYVLVTLLVVTSLLYIFLKAIGYSQRFREFFGDDEKFETKPINACGGVNGA